MKDYLHLIKRLYAIDTDVPQGYTESELSQAVQRLGCALPETLKQYYLLLGKNEAVNTAYNFLLTPDEIYYADSGHLVFYEENQAVAVWGIDQNSLEQPNPVVWGSYDIDKEEWFEDAPAMDHFLWSMACWNAVLGGLPYTAMQENPAPQTIAFIENNWEEQKDRSSPLQRFFTDKDSAILVLSINGEQQADGLYIAGNNQMAYQRIIDKLDLQWDDRTEA